MNNRAVVQMVPGNSIELQVRYINRLHFIFRGSRFYHMAGIALSLVKLISFCSALRVFFRFIFFSTFFFPVVIFVVGVSYSIYGFHVFFFSTYDFYPPTFSYQLCLYSGIIIITWWYREMFAFTYILGPIANCVYTADIKEKANT